MELSQEMIDLLKRIASQPTLCDNEDFNPYDASGGNYDDAYYMGSEDGYTKLAREILTQLKVPFNKNHKF